MGALEPRCLSGEDAARLVELFAEAERVAAAGRTVTAAQRRALEARDPTCVVEGCEVREHIEIDHVDGWALTRTTTLA
ncbi:MAG: HNH endonuclease signature motif containing protein, partial [Acidimicrobiales bacterium]